MTYDLTNIPEFYHEAVATNERFYNHGFFTTPSKNDIDDYKQWAREHYKPEQKIDPLWHPVIVAECLNIIREFRNGG